MKALRKLLSKEQFHLLNIPKDFADEVDVIILPSKSTGNQQTLSDEEAFYAANYEEIIDTDTEEDKIWSKYL